MGWSISHGRSRMPGGDIVRPYHEMSDLGRHLAHALPAHEWRKISGLFRRKGDPFTVPPRDAATAADAFHAGAKNRRVPRYYRSLAKDLADAAQRAAHGNQPWQWR